MKRGITLASVVLLAFLLLAPADLGAQTRDETVVRERPVRRAISARLAVPAWRRTATTCPRFRSRSALIAP